MKSREITSNLLDDLAHLPAVALLGARQVGKSTLAREIGTHFDGSVYLDLEDEQDRAKLASASLFLEPRLDRLVILDEVHRVPALFAQLRGLIDTGRRAGRRAGMYLLLGSASLDLLRQSGESLAGRIGYRELAPLTVRETGDPQTLWLRGGFPDSFLATDQRRSLRWRLDFIRTYVERDVPMFGGQVNAQALRLLWGMLAHQHGALANSATLARSLALDVRTVNRYVDLLVQLFVVRRLPPWHVNVGKRLTRSPKLYVRDSGILHALLSLDSMDALLGHPVVGASWEGFVMENLITAAGPYVTPYFYRTSAGAEIDLLLAWPGDELWAIEIKRSLAPKLERGFHTACEDLQPARKFVAYPGEQAFPLVRDVQAVPLAELCALIAHQAAR